MFYNLNYYEASPCNVVFMEEVEKKAQANYVFYFYRLYKCSN